MDRWQNQQEAFEFAMKHKATMLDMDMGTGKTRVALDVAFARRGVKKILVVCPKAVIPVWRHNLQKFYNGGDWYCWDMQKGTVVQKAQDLEKWINMGNHKDSKLFVVVNYDIVWRKELGDYINRSAGFDLVILDESHRAKSAGSKVSKYLAMIGKKVDYKLCLSGTPMANSPLDVYGQYRFLDSNIFGTSHYLFLCRYAIMGGPDSKFVVGYQNQQELNAKFRSIAYSCKMSDVADKIKLPDALPPICRYVELPTRDMKTIKELSKDFVAECGAGHVIVNNVLTKLLRIQQICSGFCLTQESIFDAPQTQELNTAKQDELFDILSDVSPLASVVVFCVFRHDLTSIRQIAEKSQRKYFELSGSENTLEEWKKCEGAVIGVQIQAGSEGVDMTNAHYAIYYSIPHSLALYNQSKARLYRPNQKNAVSFIHLLAENTVDVAMYKSLVKKKDVIESIKDGSFDFGYTH
jgi:SNF2 family DNA or RNA helicase